jgi:diphosphomevalonate decarboxylase
MNNQSLASTAVAHPNIAFIKYWGNRDDRLRLPQNGSISMNLRELTTTTRVEFSTTFKQDSLLLNEREISGAALQRVSSFLDHVRVLANSRMQARVTSSNNFPIGAGIASSAAAFAALSLAASAALELNLSEKELSRLARLGSGSACRSVPGGFVEWIAGKDDADSTAVSIAPADHWNLVDCIAVIQTGHKPVGSTEGHALAGSSPLQGARVTDTPRRLDLCRQAIEQRNFSALADIVEQDSTIMHAVMMTSIPPLFYWEDSSLRIMKHVTAWRAAGLPACYTLDAGSNVHVITMPEFAGEVRNRLMRDTAVQNVIVATPGGAAHLVD